MGCLVLLCSGHFTGNMSISFVKAWKEHYRFQFRLLSCFCKRLLKDTISSPRNKIWALTSCSHPQCGQAGEVTLSGS